MLCIETLNKLSTEDVFNETELILANYSHAHFPPFKSEQCMTTNAITWDDCAVFAGLEAVIRRLSQSRRVLRAAAAFQL